MTNTTSHDLIDQVLDPGSFISWDTPPVYGDISDDYRATLDRAREKSGVDEAVITGEGTVNGARVAFVLSEFGFLGGSIGAATARRIIDGIHRATEGGLPLLISPASGGTRM
ncbi:acetyl-CoA carboxyl transferase, partial [Dermabacteraceae bacterium TAE3-ERU27]|nr:acetyl-CoA carboxyl transferase [Dermabacteraceae bacterium TAE3-ERU27]